MCISWVSLVNMYKIPENDLVGYINAFEVSGRVGFFEWYEASEKEIIVPIKDFGYKTYVVAISHLISRNVYIFKFTTSFVVYTLMGVSLVKAASKYKIPTSVVVTLICLMSFTPWIFTMSLQIIRQFMAGAIVFFLLVRRTFYMEWKDFIKNNWPYIVLMFLIHKSSLFFAILLCMPFLGKPIKYNRLKYLILLGVLAAYQLMAGVILRISGVSTDTALGETFERASKDTTFELRALSPVHVLLIVLIIFLGIMVAYKSKYSANSGVKHAYNVIIVLAAFILLNLHQLELSVRFYNYLICFLPFAILPFLMRVKSLSSLYVMCIIVVICWILYLKYGVWTYGIPGNVITTPVLGYFL